MKITTILFDLDGTLLPMDQDQFTNAYFKMLCKRLVPHGYQPENVVNGIWSGTKEMIKNDGKKSNEEVFWLKFKEFMGEDIEEKKPLFEDFYANEFQQVENLCKKNPLAKIVVDKAKELGFRVVLATNPIFPHIATQSRARWAGFDLEEFEFYTTYENAGYCKPNPNYYRFILEKLNVKPEECLMVGNDVEEDAVAAGSLGIRTFIVNDCIINKDNRDISHLPNGSFDDLLQYIQTINE